VEFKLQLKGKDGDGKDEESAASKIVIQGARYPENLEKRTGL
jgi:hypothetical protein